MPQKTDEQATGEAVKTASSDTLVSSDSSQKRTESEANAQPGWSTDGLAYLQDQIDATPIGIIVPMVGRTQQGRDADARLEEAMGLAQAIKVEIRHTEAISVRQVKPGTYLGSGKIEELRDIGRASGIEIWIFDCDLSPIQQRNLETKLESKVIDRTALILEIFGARASTREGELQVELAHLNYQKSRLVRSWTHLERQRGGAGFMGGPGETQIEADRRYINDRISRLKGQLKEVERTRTLHRAQRQKAPYPVVALVGYTNAGKSTLFNRLTDAEVLAEDMLFATLDPTLRGISLPSGRRIILSDTVGFISNLPTTLVAAFRATLEEVLEADLVLHVRDASHPDTELQKDDVLAVLKELGVKLRTTDGEGDGAVAALDVLNKVDLMTEGAQEVVLERTAHSGTPASLVSAITGRGCDRLLTQVDSMLGAGDVELCALVDYADGATQAFLREKATILEEEATDTGFRFTFRIDPIRWARYQKR